VPLTAAVEVFKRWLHLGDDDAPVLVVAATVVATARTATPSGR
jgi:hypothetical protein